jgi:hypothetical protein
VLRLPFSKGSLAYQSYHNNYPLSLSVWLLACLLAGAPVYVFMKNKPENRAVSVFVCRCVVCGCGCVGMGVWVCHCQSPLP